MSRVQILGQRHAEQHDGQHVEKNQSIEVIALIGDHCRYFPSEVGDDATTPCRKIRCHRIRTRSPALLAGLPYPQIFLLGGGKRLPRLPRMLCAHHSLVQYEIPDRRSSGKRIDARAQHQEAYASDGQRPRLKTSARIKKEERDESVKVEDVAMVKKITVQDAEQDQPHVAPKVNIGCPSLSLALLNAAGEQDDARAEEQGEQRGHLAFHDQPGCEPYRGIA